MASISYENWKEVSLVVYDNNPSLSLQEDLRVFLTLTLGILTLRVVLSGAYSKKLRIPCILRLFSSGIAENKRWKWHENVWYSMWHSFSTAFNLYVLTSEPWFLKLLDLEFQGGIMEAANEAFFQGWPEAASLSESGRMFYLTALSFWVSCLTMILLETIRKDFYQMLLHHFFTIALVSMSYALNFHRVGQVVLLLHDVGDIFLYTAKSSLYWGWKRAADVLFVGFVLGFGGLRMVLYPALCVLPAIIYCVPKGVYVQPLLLALLQCIHVFWWVLIMKMVKNVLKKATVTEDGDCRSDSESDDEEEEEELENCQRVQKNEKVQNGDLSGKTESPSSKEGGVKRRGRRM